MKQISLFDSFMKHKKQQQPQNHTPPPPPKQPKTGQKPTADKPPIDHTTPAPHTRSPPLEQADPQPQNHQKSNFKELISNGDFAFETVTVISNKRRKMDIEDDLIPKHQHKKPAFQKMEIEQNEEHSSQKNQQTKKYIRPSITPPKSVTKKSQDDKPKRATFAAPTTSGQDAPEEQFTDVTPEWATLEGCRDAKGHRPNHPEYDPTTLYLPPQAIKALTETMKQYWRIKSQNYDKLILFKLGKFYQMFYDDAAIGNRFLDLKWMGNKMHVGFPQKCLQKYAHEFVQLGYKLVVVEQLETPDQMKERMSKDRNQGRKTEKTLQRGVTQVLTKGTMISFEDDQQYLPNYLIAVSKHNHLIAYSLLQMGTNLIMVGLSQTLQDFKTMLFQTRPVQLLYDPDNLPLQIVDLMKINWLNMVLTKLPNRENVWHPMNTKNQIQNLVSSAVFPLPAIFESLQKTGGEEEKLILATLAGMFRYLKSCLKFDYIMSAVRFAFYEREGSAMSMIMDSQALQHLEVFETPIGQKDALFNKIDKTTTKFGKRLLRRWLMQPLLDPVKINHRLDAIQDLESVSIDRNRVTDILCKLPDLQKIVNRLYHYSVKAIAEKAIYFEDVSSARLRQFKQLIQHFNKSWHALEMLRKHKSKFKSRRLVQLLTSQSKDQQNQQEQQEDKGLLPPVRQNLAQFDEYIKWDGDIPRPQKGLVQSYDMLQDQLGLIKIKLQDYLDQVRKLTGLPSLKYVHTKQRYEIEIPEQIQKKRLPNMIFTSKRSGYSRYVTEQSRKYVADIQYVQHQIKDQMGLFVGYFFQQFRKNQKIWQKFLSVLAEIDCLISLSAYSYQSGGVRPQFVQTGFDLREAKHPCLNADDVIPNNISLNSKIMLLTGPNMGGKSTLLRTTCLLVILAQTGCFVPAEAYECEIIDRIFTRIGASDKLDEGKSTFFIQMEQTKSILNYGTSKSLAIIDELGRGTSTFDGMAIAYSVLLDLIERVQCRCLFATHYHTLSQQFQNISAVDLKMMNYMVAEQKIIFLYKLKEGRAEHSFGLNVAKVVKIPQHILQIAQRRATMMEEEITRKDKFKKLKQAISFALQ